MLPITMHTNTLTPDIYSTSKLTGKRQRHTQMSYYRGLIMDSDTLTSTARLRKSTKNLLTAFCMQFTLTFWPFSCLSDDAQAPSVQAPHVSIVTSVIAVKWNLLL